MHNDTILPLWYLYINVAFFSLFIGSFLNVCIYRIPLKKSIVFPSSHCPNCKSILKPIDLVPVLSYLFYRARCRYCKKRISPRYPLIEILTSVLIFLNFYVFGFSFKFFVNSFMTCVFIVASFIDFDYQIIPDELTIGGLVVAFLFQALINVIAPELADFFYQVGMKGAIFGALVGGGILYIIAYLSRGGMGGGDVKLAALIGALYGVKIVAISLFISFLLGGTIGLLLIIFRIKGRKDYIPFGPYIALGTLITLLVGADSLIKAYYSMPARLF